MWGWGGGGGGECVYGGWGECGYVCGGVGVCVERE